MFQYIIKTLWYIIALTSQVESLKLIRTRRHFNWKRVFRRLHDGNYIWHLQNIKHTEQAKGCSGSLRAGSSLWVYYNIIPRLSTTAANFLVPTSVRQLQLNWVVIKAAVARFCVSSTVSDFRLLKHTVRPYVDVSNTFKHHPYGFTLTFRPQLDIHIACLVDTCCLRLLPHRDFQYSCPSLNNGTLFNLKSTTCSLAAFSSNGIEKLQRKHYKFKNSRRKTLYFF